MDLSIKEQMIGLIYSGVNYRSQKCYLSYFFQEHLQQEVLSMKEIYQIIKMLRLSNQFTDQKVIDWQVAELAYFKQLAKSTIIFGEAHYPPLWYQLAQPPLLLFYQGDLSCLNRPMVSIVGSRVTTEYGRMMTESLVAAFAKEGWGVVSGLARGIDRIVHETSLAYHSRSTVALIASGLNRTYPSEHQQLQQTLAKNHLVISEYLPDSPPLKHHFIMRNRLIAGISPITCVMEAAEKSGSLITANYALQCNREVFALPGRVIDKQSQGCNQLIASGAYPILNVSETVSEIRQLFKNQNYF